MSYNSIINALFFLEKINIKTIHDTSVTSTLDNHRPFNAKFSVIDTQFAHTNHYRLYYNNFLIPISDIVFDYNYFFCYFKPTIAKFKSSNNKYI
jgi:hypothetical protein